MRSGVVVVASFALLLGCLTRRDAGQYGPGSGGGGQGGSPDAAAGGGAVGGGGRGGTGGGGIGGIGGVAGSGPGGGGTAGTGGTGGGVDWAYRKAVLSESQLVFYLPFDEASGASQLIPQGVPPLPTLTASGIELAVSSPIQDGSPNRAARFSGTELAAGDIHDFVGSESFSVELWFCITQITSVHQLFTKRDLTAGGYHARVRPPDEVIFFRTAPTSCGDSGLCLDNVSPANSGAVQTNRWYHFVATHGKLAGGSNQEVCAYLRESGDTSATNHAADCNKAGVDLVDHSAPLLFAQDFQGSVDEIAIYRERLSLQQIANHFAAASSPPNSSCSGN